MNKFTHTIESAGDIVLDSGQSLSQIDIVYHTIGTLDDDKRNVILICHPLTGDSHASAWWPTIVGPGLPIDTNNYFVICTNVLGGCAGTTGPGSINPCTKQPYGLDFPVITIGDMVRIQRELLDALGIQTIKMVVGGSMGGMQALEWVAQAPDRVESCLPIASTTQVSPLAVAFDSVGRHAILEQLKSGDGLAGLAVARQLGHITYLSDEALQTKFSRRLQDGTEYSYTMDPEFQVESYLNYQGKKFLNRFDLYSYLYLTKAVSYFDLAKSYGSIEKALGKSKARFLVLSIRSDWLYTANQSRALAYELMKMNKYVSYVDIDSDDGHDTFLIESDQTKQVIRCFLDGL
ncbi:MAG: homoserine O-acetyltransferase MetX [Candidatus Marinamargulisbacteria bacterium]